MEAVSPTTTETKERRKPAPIRYPSYDLADSVAVAKAIHEKGGGIASRDQLAAFLLYKTTNSGAFISRLAAARLFNLIESNGPSFVITPLAQKILMPVYPEQAREALVEAFLSVPLYRTIYEEFKGKELPPEFGMKNLLRSKGIAADLTGSVYRTMMDSAETAGFFATRGARTHLILPQLQPTKPPAEQPPQEGQVERGGDGGRGQPPPPREARSSEELRNEYVGTLIELLRDRAKSDGEVDFKLMERIEKLLGIEGGEAT